MCVCSPFAHPYLYLRNVPLTLNSTTCSFPHTLARLISMQPTWQKQRSLEPPGITTTRPQLKKQGSKILLRYFNAPSKANATQEEMLFEGAKNATIRRVRELVGRISLVSADGGVVLTVWKCLDERVYHVNAHACIVALPCLARAAWNQSRLAVASLYIGRAFGRCRRSVLPTVFLLCVFCLSLFFACLIQCIHIIDCGPATKTTAFHCGRKAARC